MINKHIIAITLCMIFNCTTKQLNASLIRNFFYCTKNTNIIKPIIDDNDEIIFIRKNKPTVKFLGPISEISAQIQALRLIATI